MKAMFADKLGVTFDSKETTLELNGCSIQAYPSNHIDAFRSLDNPKFIMLDESDFHARVNRMSASSIRKIHCQVRPLHSSCDTPNAPGGLFEKIEKEPIETCLYKKFFLDYLWGVGKIYTQEEIDKAKLSPSFPREYQLQYLGLIGNVFSTLSIENCQKIEYNPDNINPNAKKSIGIDPGFGSSKFAIVITQYVDGKIQVISCRRIR